MPLPYPTAALSPLLIQTTTLKYDIKKGLRLLTTERNAKKSGEAGRHAHERAVAQHLPAAAEHFAREPR